MTEKAINFGPGNGFTGVLSMPEAGISKDTPGVIILNSGLVHKVGPFRLSVDLARELEKQNFFVLRLDLSGIGDSRMRLVNDKEDLAVEDIKIAMNFLFEKFGLSKFILMGLCSGSDNSHRASLSDQRIIGSVHLDGYCYRNKKYYLTHYGKRLLSLSFISKKINNKFFKKKSVKHTANEANAYNRAFPPLEQATREMALLADRNVKMLYIFTGGVDEYYNYQGQFYDIFKPINFKNNLTEIFYPIATHTYSRVKDRNRVVKTITDWLSKNYI